MGTNFLQWIPPTQLSPPLALGWQLHYNALQINMADQLTVRLSKELSRALDVASRKLERRRSEIVRMALRHYLDLLRTDGRRPAERARSLIGSLESGQPDLAERHREYILESLRNAS